MSELVLDKNNELPIGWVKTCLDEICDVILGQSPPSNTYNENENGLPFFQGKADFGDLHPIPRIWCSQPQKIAESGDVLLSVRAPVGSTNLSNQQCCIGRGLSAIRPKIEEIPSKFFLYFFMNIRQDLDAKGTGTTFKAISGQQIRSLEIQLPPLNEQKRIVTKIEELFSLLDSIKQLLEKIKNQLKQYQQSLLKSTFEGEFVKELQMSKFVDICKKITDGEHLKPKFLDSGVPFLSAKNITKLGLSFEDVKYVSNVDAENFRKKCDPKLNDILMVSRGNVGRTCIVNTNNLFCLLGSVILLQLKSNIDSKYVLYFLKTSSNLKKLTRISSSTVQGAIYLQDLKQLTIPIPSLNEQKIIVEKIEESLSLIEKTKKFVDLLLFQNNYMKNSILKHAFEGKLVLQDPTDESVEILLQKIKQEKQKIIDQSKRGKKNDK